MKKILASALFLLAPVIALAQASVPAKVEGKTPASKAAAKPKAASTAKPANKTAAKKQAAKKTVVAKASPVSSRTQLHSAATQVAAGAVAVRNALSPDELAVAERVQVGRMPCELGAFVTVAADTVHPGGFQVSGKGFNYYMTPVVTTTGTVRLEDTKAGAVWLQIANKSMLMNQKLGQRLADECMSAEQIVVAEAIKKNPPVSVLEPLPVGK